MSVGTIVQPGKTVPSEQLAREEEKRRTAKKAALERELAVKPKSIPELEAEAVAKALELAKAPTPPKKGEKATPEYVKYLRKAPPPQLPFTILAGFVIIVLSLSTTYFLKQHGSGSLFIKIMVIISLMGIFIAVDMMDFWLLIFFIIMAIAIAYASKQGSVA